MRRLAERRKTRRKERGREELHVLPVWIPLGHKSCLHIPAAQEGGVCPLVNSGAVAAAAAANRAIFLPLRLLKSLRNVSSEAAGDTPTYIRRVCRISLQSEAPLHPLTAARIRITSSAMLKGCSGASKFWPDRATEKSCVTPRTKTAKTEYQEFY